VKNGRKEGRTDEERVGTQRKGGGDSYSIELQSMPISNVATASQAYEAEDFNLSAN